MNKITMVQALVLLALERKFIRLPGSDRRSRVSEILQDKMMDDKKMKIILSSIILSFELHIALLSS